MGGERELAHAGVGGCAELSVPVLARRSSLWSGNASGGTVDVMGHALADVTLADATTDIIDRAAAGRRARVVFVNAHVVTSALDNHAYRETVATADLRLGDGSGLALAARLAGDALGDNVNGTDMLPLLAAEAQRRGTSLFLLGGIPGAAAASADTIARLGCTGAIAGTHHGYFAHASAAEHAVIDAINASGAGIVLVGMGVPIQDEWIARNAARLTAPVLIGVGGLFDFFSGRRSRAPKLLRTLGLEWTWRFALEPSRMAHRYLVGNAVFLTHALRCAAKVRMGRRGMGGSAQPIAP